MITGQTPRSARYWRRKQREENAATFDPAAKRYMVYRLLDLDGVPVYIGRSCNVAGRIRSHYSAAGALGDPDDGRPTWIYDVRSVSMRGPFTWKEAVRIEREEIEHFQPRGNIHLTKAHGFRPLAEGGGRYFTRPRAG